MSVKLEFDGSQCTATVERSAAPGHAWHAVFDTENPEVVSKTIDNIVDRITESAKTQIMIGLFKERSK